MPGRLLRAVTPAGRGTLGLGLLALLVGRVTHLVELRLLAALCGVLVLLAVPWLLVPSRARGRVSLHPARAVAGESVTIRLGVTNVGRWPLWQPVVRVPVGDREERLPVPPLRARGRFDAELEVPTSRRGVLPVGPPAGRRTDPLGLLRRDTPWCPPLELYVRPRVVDLPTLGVGRLRDLEGVPSDRLSMSDLAFHALREYVPGDDLRHVHWRSSARAGELLVRQYHESRRNQAAVVVDSARAAYGDPEDFETACSVAASLVVCGAREEYLLTLAAGRERVSGRPPGDVLDALCRLDLADDAQAACAPEALVGDVLGLAPDTGLLFVVSGGDRGLDDLAVACLPVAPEVRVVLVRVDAGARPGLVRHLGREVLTVPTLADLPALTVAFVGAGT